MKRALALALLGVGVACGPQPASAPRPKARPLDISVAYEVQTLDPHAWNYLGNFALVSHFYEPLVTTDAEMRLTPCLARAWQNPDPSTWVFYLEPRARFHSGRALSARDVVYTIRRLLSEPGLEMKAYVLHVDDVAALDDLTVRIHTRQPVAVLLNSLRFVGIVPEGASAEALARAPDGTGPYVLDEWKKGVSLRMSANAAYWGTPPPIKAVTFHLGRTPEQAAEDLLSGRSRLASCDSRAVAAALERAGRFEILRHTTLRVEFLGFDLHRDPTPGVSLARNPFLDPLVRRAVHLAIDRKRLIAGLTTDAVPATQLVSPFVFGFNPGIPPPPYEPEEARALLRRARLPRGFKAVLDARPSFREAAESVREQLGTVGIQVEVRSQTQAEFMDRMRRHDSSFFIGRFGAVTGDAGDLMESAIHSPDASGLLGVNNYGGHSNPEIDRLIDRSFGIDSVEGRKAALGLILERLMEDLPWVPLDIGQDVYALDRSLRWTPRHDSFILAQEVAERGS